MDIIDTGGVAAVILFQFIRENSERTSRAGISLFPRVPGQGYQHDRGLPHERVPQDSGRTVNNAQNTTQKTMTRTRQSKGPLRANPPLAALFSRQRQQNAGNAQQKAIHA